MGQAPEIVEDQVTYPLTTAMLAVPHAKTVRGFSMFGDSFVYVIFADGTDPYWARSRVLEQLSTLSGRLPAGVTPRLGPDATGVGWVFQYVLVTGRWSPDHPQGLWYDATSDTWYTNEADAPAGSQLERRRTFREKSSRWYDAATHRSWERPELAPASLRETLVEVSSERELDADPLTGTALVDNDVDLAELRAIQDWYLRYELTAVDGVSEVAGVGGFEKQYQITVDPVRLLAFGISVTDVAEAVRMANRDQGGRVIERGETELLVRGRGYLGDLSPEDRSALAGADSLTIMRARSAQVLADLGSIAVGRTPAGSPVSLRDVATIGTGPELRTGIADWMGEGDAVGAIVIMRQGGNARDTIAAVRKRLEVLRTNLPPGVDVVTAYDRSDLIERAVSTLTNTLAEEILTVSLVVLLFLLHARSALVAVLVLPTGVLGSLLLMRVLGINANIMSLGGIAVAIGVMVDSSIIMVENAHKHLEVERARRAAGEAEKPLLRIVGDAACEVGPTLFFSLLIITVSFLPVFVLVGQSGRMFSPLASTKTFAMGMAAVLSVTLIPVLMTVFIRERTVPAAWSALARRSVYWLATLVPAAVIAVVPLATLDAWRWLLVAGWLLFAGIVVLPQRFHAEDRHPLSKLLMATYRPAFALSMKYPWMTVGAALLAVVVTIVPWTHIGEEFMPPLEEGDFLYMPNADPGLSVGKASELLRQTDRLIAQFPEVAGVMGKAGRSDTATDPAPMTMFETTIMLQRDRTKWRQVPTTRWFGLIDDTRPITLEELTDGYDIPGGKRVPGINDVLRIPGLSGALTRGAMPIRTRIDMLATGIRTPVGVKIMGPDYATLDRLAAEVVSVLQTAPELRGKTKNATTERLTGGSYVDVRIDREAIARHGLSIDAVQLVVATALGGEVLTYAVEGRERYGVNLRYASELRDSPERLAAVLVPTPSGAQVPLAQLAHIEERMGMAMVRSENARPSAWLFVTPTDRDVAGYVERAQVAVTREVALPQGYSVAWSGSFEQIEASNRRLAVAIPLTLVAILMLLYAATRSWVQTSIVIGALSFSAVGAVWFVFLLDYQWSVAVAVGVIALLGLDAETSLVMLHYQDASIAHAKSIGRFSTRAHVWTAIYEGAVQRIRPKTMTVVTTLVGLLPLMWGDGAGADTMRRLAAPMIGGLFSSFTMELLVFPALYYLIQRRGLPD
jgi:copper/silver efflux system protein